MAPKPPAGLALMALSALVGQVKVTLAKFITSEHTGHVHGIMIL